MSGGQINQDNIESTIDEFISEQDFSDLTDNYLIPKENFQTFFAGLLKGFLGVKATNPTITIDEYLKMTEIDKTFSTLAIAITEVTMKQAILTKIGNLTSYLTSSFSNAFNIDEGKLLSAFKLNFTEEELSRIVNAMFTKKKSTLSTNLALLGYQDLDNPFEMAFYFESFDGKTNFINFLDDYNELMESYDSKDKVIEYTDTTGILMSSVKTIVDAVSYVLIAFVSISLVVSSIMIGVITYISVYERTKEIGILRAIGASKHNISSIFNAETVIIGLLSGLFGITISYLLIPIINAILHHFIGDIPLSASLDQKMAAFLIILSIVLTLIGGLIPARSASKKDPVEALRSE
jgi:ABC-type antimicrobial peptide transport system permease subunit